MPDSSDNPYMPTRPSLGAYVLDAPDIRPGWVLAYAGTFALQMLCATVRAILVLLTLEVAFWILGEPNWLAQALALTIGYGPLALSFATLLLPVGGWLWMQQAGGRSPSERERLIYQDALAVLAEKERNLRPPRRWFVLDEPYLNAAAYADTLMVTRGLLESGFLEAVLAHELGHLNSSDARLTAALHRMTTPPRRQLRFPFRAIAFIASGALGVWVTRTPWAAYWRGREYHADQYAARLGQAQPLARFLDTNALQDDLPVPFVWLTQHSHPFTEHRIDQLHQQGEPT
jgi:Zn-dependent protease with chaperone function